ncbi:MAG: OmpA family protein [Myxococcaceae bacterium]|nr:OmpA family protein [Myxococcaceae bacterium]
MSHLFSALTLGLCLASAAQAQSADEWSSLSSSSPAVPDAGVAAPPPTPQAAVKASPPAPTIKPEAKARVEERLRAARGEAPPVTAEKVPKLKDGEEADPSLSVVSTKERYEAGTEPHSPSTWKNAYNAPSNARITAGAVGVGLVHLSSARIGPQGLLRFSVLGEYMNQLNFPVRSSQNIRSAGTFGVSFQPFEWGEVFLGYSAMANTNSRTSPNLIQALGDLALGLKVARHFGKGLHAGVDLRLLTYSAVGNQSVDRFAVGFAPRLLAAWDVRGVNAKIPAIVHLNVGFALDTTANLLTQTLRAPEQYALSVNRFNRFTLGVGLEAPLPLVTPYLEYNMALPLGVPATGLVGPDTVAVAVGQAMPQTLGLGLKITAVKDLTLSFGFDLGLARSVGLGIPATPPWNMLLGASFNVDPFGRGETKFVETVRERKVEQAVAKGGKVEGTVIDAKTKEPLPGVIVAMVGAGLPPVASDTGTGKFLTHELPLGTVKLHASKDGYKEIEQELKIEDPKQPVKVELLLEQVERKAVFDVTVTGKKKPINAVVVFRGPVEQSAGTTEGVAAPVKVEVPPGTYTASVTAEGFLSQTREVQVAANGQMAVAFDLMALPKKSLVIVKNDKIEILQQVHFATGKATILADSYSLLQQVVDAVVRNNIRRVRIEGHTDNRGKKDFNLTLSQDRAKAVADYMVSQGVDRARLDAQGFGDGRPVAPNLTARGRELNRRVEFFIVEK